MNAIKLKPTILSMVISSVVLTGCGWHANVEEKTELRDAPLVGKESVTAQSFRQPTAEFLDEVVVTGTRMVSVEEMTIYPGQAMVKESDSENYADYDDSGISRVSENAVSTFSIDVDTGAYSNVRRILNSGHLPPVDAVRAEELINYFSYDYPQPEEHTAPFGFSTEISVSPWNPEKHLLHIGLQARELESEGRLQSNLVFLLDVSGSMNSPDKLDLLRTSLKLLSRQLNSQDSVAIVVYAGASGVVLEPTAGNDVRKIAEALDQLSAGGSTNGAAGIQLAYQLAQDAFVDGGINRVLLATDGDFNVGMSDIEELKDLISEKRELGISLTTLGFGRGNYNDQLMEQLADVGNGNYAYIDNINEARKVLVDELGSTLQTVAKDVKIQIEFNPSVVAEYRLVGYENRLLQREDFNNDKVDAGEIGAGHTVTAIYEVSLVNSKSLSVDPLRYAERDEITEQQIPLDAELAYLKLRYKAPDADTSQLLEQAILVADINQDIASTSENYRFSAAVAGMAQLLRKNHYSGEFDYDSVLALANGAKGKDEFGYRSEFVGLVRTAQALSSTTLPSTTLSLN